MYKTNSANTKQFNPTKINPKYQIALHVSRIEKKKRERRASSRVLSHSAFLESKSIFSTWTVCTGTSTKSLTAVQGLIDF
jgi:hypothetical protein